MSKKTIIIDEKLYPKEAVYGAAYVFIDKAYIFLDKKEKEKIEITLKLKPDNKEDLEKLEGEFMNELLNYTLRLSVSKNNKNIREMIVGQALVAAGGEKLVNEKEFEYVDDPLGIAVPWEEKYGNKKKVNSKQ